MAKERSRLTVRLKLDLADWLKHRAVDKHVSVAALIEQLIERERAKVEARQ